jgi:hypothetical protein
VTARAPVAIVVGMESLGEDLLLLSIGPDRGRIGNVDKIDFGLMGAELVRLAWAGPRSPASGSPWLTPHPPATPSSTPR